MENAGTSGRYERIHSATQPDRLVREIDVWLCSGVLGTNTKMYLLQYPLRPPWRSYDLDSCETVNFKPEAKRLELATTLETRGHNYNGQADASKQLNALVLKSQCVQLQASFAVGCLKGDRLMLSPLDEALQMRPQTGRLDDSKKPIKDEDMAEEEDKKPTFVTVQVQRRETERQAEQRVNSYAYIARQEAEEKWKSLSCASADSHMASSLWNKLMTPPEGAKLPTMPRDSYLSILTSGTGQAENLPSNPQQGTHTGRDVSVTGQVMKTPAVASAAGVKAAAMGANGIESSYLADGSPVQHDANDVAGGAPLEAAAQKALPAALIVMFKKHSVVNMHDVRGWLTSYDGAGAARSGASASDQSLHTALLKTGIVTSVKQIYVQTKVANGGPADALRGVLLDMLKDKPNVRRADVLDTARAEGVSVSDGVYQKVMKDMCTSRGNVWTLKAGA